MIGVPLPVTILMYSSLGVNSGFLIQFGHSTTQVGTGFPIAFTTLTYSALAIFTWGSAWPEVCNIAPGLGNKQKSACVFRGASDGNVKHNVQYILIGY